MLLNKCHHLNAIQTVQRQPFKARSDQCDYLAEGSKKSLKLLLPVLEKKRQRPFLEE